MVVIAKQSAMAVNNVGMELPLKHVLFFVHYVITVEISAKVQSFLQRCNLGCKNANPSCNNANLGCSNAILTAIIQM